MQLCPLDVGGSGNNATSWIDLTIYSGAGKSEAPKKMIWRISDTAISELKGWAEVLEAWRRSVPERGPGQC